MCSRGVCVYARADAVALCVCVRVLCVCTQGLMLSRVGAGVDDKAFLVRALEAYQEEHKCRPWNVAPPTIELNDTAKCHAFFHHNWSPLTLLVIASHVILLLS